MATPRCVTIKFTKEQQNIIRAACGRASDAIELTVEQLEERIAPSVLTKGTGGLTDFDDGSTTAGTPDVCDMPGEPGDYEPTPIDLSGSEVGDDPATVKTDVETKEDALKGETLEREPTAQELEETTTSDEPLGIDDSAISIDESGTTLR